MLDGADCRRWSSSPSEKCSYELPARGTVCGKMRLRFTDSCIIQLEAQGPSRTCDESKEEDEEDGADSVYDLWFRV